MATFQSQIDILAAGNHNTNKRIKQLKNKKESKLLATYNEFYTSIRDNQDSQHITIDGLGYYDYENMYILGNEGLHMINFEGGMDYFSYGDNNSFYLNFEGTTKLRGNVELENSYNKDFDFDLDVTGNIILNSNGTQLDSLKIIGPNSYGIYFDNETHYLDFSNVEFTFNIYKPTLNGNTLEGVTITDEKFNINESSTITFNGDCPIIINSIETNNTYRVFEPTDLTHVDITNITFNKTNGNVDTSQNDQNPTRITIYKKDDNDSQIILMQFYDDVFKIHYGKKYQFEGCGLSTSHDYLFIYIGCKDPGCSMNMYIKFETPNSSGLTNIFGIVVKCNNTLVIDEIPEAQLPYKIHELEILSDESHSKPLPKGKFINISSDTNKTGITSDSETEGK